MLFLSSALFQRRSPCDGNFSLDLETTRLSVLGGTIEAQARCTDPYGCPSSKAWWCSYIAMSSDRLILGQWGQGTSRNQESLLFTISKIKCLGIVNGFLYVFIHVTFLVQNNRISAQNPFWKRTRSLWVTSHSWASWGVTLSQTILF